MLPRKLAPWLVLGRSHGWFLVGWLHGWFLVRSWLVHGWFMVGSWLVHGWFLVGFWLVSVWFDGWFVDGLWLVSNWLVHGWFWFTYGAPVTIAAALRGRYNENHYKIEIRNKMLHIPAQFQDCRPPRNAQKS